MVKKSKWSKVKMAKKSKRSKTHFFLPRSKQSRRPGPGVTGLPWAGGPPPERGGRPSPAAYAPPRTHRRERTASYALPNAPPCAPPYAPPFTETGFLQVYAIDTAQVAGLVHTPLAGSYLQLVDDQPGGLGALALPQLDAGPFLSYGIQWIAFGILAPIGLGYFVLAEIRARRREATAVHQSAAAPDEPLTVEEKLADRYGRRR